MLLMAGVTCFWFFALGTAFGSFLNVVVYRMPRGLPVTGSSSHCPGCRRLIPWHDNVPIIGWYRLGGRCQCRAQQISARYPIIETIVGLLVLALLLVELLSGGENLPLRQPSYYKGVVGVIWSLQWDLIGTFGYHLTLLYVLLGLSLIDLDGFAPPVRWVVFGLLVGLLAPLAAPFLQMVPLTGAAAAALPPGATRIEALARSLVGLAAGTGLGVVVSLPWGRDRSRPNGFLHLIAQLALIGTFLGWQAALSVALASSFALLIQRRALSDEPGMALIPSSLIVWVLTLIQILVWQPLNHLTAWPGPATSAPALVIAALTMLVFVFLTNRMPIPDPVVSQTPMRDRPHVSVEAIEPVTITSDDPGSR